MPVVTSIWLSMLSSAPVVSRVLLLRSRLQPAAAGRFSGFQDLADVVLGNAEHHVNRVRLGDHHQTIGIAGGNVLPTSTCFSPTRPAIGAVMRL